VTEPLELVFFETVAVHRAAADALFAQQKTDLVVLIADADVQHVGSTALLDGLTKGDLDIQVRVPPHQYDAARAAMAPHYQLNPGGFRGADGISFKDDDTTPPLGVHLTIIDGESDIQWRFREVLNDRADLRREYDAIKQRFHGKSMDAYREVKDEFFARVAQTEAYRSTWKSAENSGGP